MLDPLLARALARVQEQGLKSRGLARVEELSRSELAIGDRENACLTCTDDVVPLIGARRRDRLAEALGALDVTLSPADFAALARAVPADAAQGERYPASALAFMDSEK